MKSLCLIAAVALVACGQVQATGRLAEVSIIDRETGSVLPLHYHRGEFWVAGSPGHRYSIQIASRQDGRLLAVTSVDGLNVLTGDTARFDQRGYVYDPWQSYEITGWRKSNAEVAAFNFTALPNSYAARTGRPGNVGVIGVALFRERPRPVLYDAPPATIGESTSRRELPPSPPPPTAAARADGSLGAAQARAEAPPELLSRRLGTGHGEREASWVQHVDFEREGPQPNEIIRIRYDSFDNLVAMGVIRRPPIRRDSPEAFPGETVVGYVPDP
jgi:hypothetical protein